MMEEKENLNQEKPDLITSSQKLKEAFRIIREIRKDHPGLGRLQWIIQDLINQAQQTVTLEEVYCLVKWISDNFIQEDDGLWLMPVKNDNGDYAGTIVIGEFLDLWKKYQEEKASKIK